MVLLPSYFAKKFINEMLDVDLWNQIKFEDYFDKLPDMDDVYSDASSAYSEDVLKKLLNKFDEKNK